MDFTAQAFDFCILDTLRKRVKLLVNLIIILSPAMPTMTIYLITELQKKDYNYFFISLSR